MVLLHHEVEVEFPDKMPNENHRATLLEFGITQNGKTTMAMALTVGIPAAIGALVRILLCHSRLWNLTLENKLIYLVTPDYAAFNSEQGSNKRHHSTPWTWGLHARYIPYLLRSNDRCVILHLCYSEGLSVLSCSTEYLRSIGNKANGKSWDFYELNKIVQRIIHNKQLHRMCIVSQCLVLERDWNIMIVDIYDIVYMYVNKCTAQRALTGFCHWICCTLPTCFSL